MGIKAGDVIRAYNLEWEVLDPNYPGEDGIGVLCLSKNPVKSMAFSENLNNSYIDSDVRQYLDGKFTPALQAHGAKFKTIKLDLTNEDGTGWENEPLEVNGAFLLTTNLYRQYRRYINTKNTFWWTATAFSNHPDYIGEVCEIVNDGICTSTYSLEEDNTVIPACVFSLSCLNKE